MMMDRKLKSVYEIFYLYYETKTDLVNQHLPHVNFKADDSGTHCLEFLGFRCFINFKPKAY